MEYETLPTHLKGLNDSIKLSQTVTEFIFMLQSPFKHTRAGNPATCPQVIRPSVPCIDAPRRDDVGHWRDQSDLLKHNSCPTCSAKLFLALRRFV
jgi:hypothetical protein